MSHIYPLLQPKIRGPGVLAKKPKMRYLPGTSLLDKMLGREEARESGRKTLCHPYTHSGQLYVPWRAGNVFVPTNKPVMIQLWCGRG